MSNRNPPVVPVSEQHLAFAKTGGNLRGTVVLLTAASPAKALQPQQLIRLISNSFDTPEEFGIQISCAPGPVVPGALVVGTYPPISPTLFVPKVIGHVVWGWEGSRNEAYFDVIHGTTIGVVGSYVEVDVRLDRTVQFTGTQQVQIQATASVGKPSSGGNVQPTLSLANINPPDPNIAVGLSFTAPVPPFAKTVRINRVPETEGILIQFQNNLQVLLQTSVPGGASPGEFEIPNGTDSVIITNQGALPLSTVQAVFGLHL